VKDPARAYRRFVEAGVVDPPDNPFDAAWEGWLLGSKKFLEKIKAQFVDPQQPDQVRQARRLRSPSAADVISAVAAQFEVPVERYCQRRSNAAGRDLAAYLAHHHTTATLRELAPHFGLTHPDSVSNLTRRAARQLAGSRKEQKAIGKIIESF
jgi:chromosomal replication initiation ATPase DnaA